MVLAPQYKEQPPMSIERSFEDEGDGDHDACRAYFLLKRRQYAAEGCWAHFCKGKPPQRHSQQHAPLGRPWDPDAASFPSPLRSP